MRKHIVLWLIVFFAGFNGFAQDVSLLGNWRIVDYNVISKVIPDSSNMDSISFIETHQDSLMLERDSVIWNLEFKQDGELLQLSNIRIKLLEGWIGTWQSVEQFVTIDIIVRGKHIPLTYVYEVSDNQLYLRRAGKRNDYFIIAKFVKVEN